jgi:hypothetical protein
MGASAKNAAITAGISGITERQFENRSGIDAPD